MPDDPLPHLRFNAPAERLNFSGQGRGNTKAPFARDRAGHATILRSQFSIIDSEFGKVAADRQLNQISSEFGLILNVVSEPDYPLAFTSLENAGRGSTPSIVLLHLRREDTPQGKVTKAAVFVPYGQLKVLVKKVEDYATKNRKDRSGNITAPRNEALLANISSISVAAFEALWTDPEQPPTADALAWFELWIRRDDERWEAQLRQKFAAHNLEFPDLKLGLPEHVVIVVQATRETIESLPRSHRVAPGYFVWPLPPAGPTPKGESQKYHYASCLLRFRPKHRDMSPEEFRSRLDADGESSRDTFQDSGWAVGGTRRGKAGSLVQDVWKGSAGQLAEMGHLFQNGFTGR